MMSVMLTLIFKYLSVILNMSFKRQRYVIEGVEKLTNDVYDNFSGIK